MSRLKPHRWTLSWPGNICLDCGLDDPYEGPVALVPCLDCSHGCKTCSGTGTVPNDDLVVPPCEAA